VRAGGRLEPAGGGDPPEPRPGDVAVMIGPVPDRPGGPREQG